MVSFITSGLATVRIIGKSGTTSVLTIGAASDTGFPPSYVYNGSKLWIYGNGVTYNGIYINVYGELDLFDCSIFGDESTIGYIDIYGTLKEHRTKYHGTGGKYFLAGAQIYSNDINCSRCDFYAMPTAYPIYSDKLEMHDGMSLSSSEMMMYAWLTGWESLFVGIQARNASGELLQNWFQNGFSGNLIHAVDSDIKIDGAVAQFSSSIHALSEHTLKLKVVGENKKPISDCRVYLTDKNGSALFTKLTCTFVQPRALLGSTSTNVALNPDNSEVSVGDIIRCGVERMLINTKSTLADKTGTTTSGSGTRKLTDSLGNFSTANVALGARVYNVTTSAYNGIVEAIDSTTVLSLSTTTIPNGHQYRIENDTAINVTRGYQNTDGCNHIAGEWVYKSETSALTDNNGEVYDTGTTPYYIQKYGCYNVQSTYEYAAESFNERHPFTLTIKKSGYKDYQTPFIIAKEAVDSGTTDATTVSCTMTIATPCVVTITNHKFWNGYPIVFYTTDALPTGITSGTTYYVRIIDADTFNLYDTAANAKNTGVTTGIINTSGTQSGTHTAHSKYLIQSGQNFLTTVSLCCLVQNATDNTFTTVIGIINDTTLLLRDDIMASGEEYIIYSPLTEPLKLNAILKKNRFREQRSYPQ
jgi:hypothetical protein